MLVVVEILVKLSFEAAQVLIESCRWVSYVPNPASVTYFTVVMTMSLYLFLDMYLHSGEYHVGTVGIDIRNYIFAVLMR